LPGGAKAAQAKASAIVSLIILKAVDIVIGLPVSEEVEVEGLDLALHDELSTEGHG